MIVYFKYGIKNSLLEQDGQDGSAVGVEGTDMELRIPKDPYQQSQASPSQYSAPPAQDYTAEYTRPNMFATDPTAFPSWDD